MGIYIFRWSVLKKFLVADEEDPKSENDFGKNVIPALLNSGYKLWAYAFEGYWKDVGTIDSLWEANMDLLGTHPNFDIRGPESEKISARNNALPSSYIAKGAKTVNCFIAEGRRDLRYRAAFHHFHRLHHRRRRPGRGQRHYAQRLHCTGRHCPPCHHRGKLCHFFRRCGGRHLPGRSKAENQRSGQKSDASGKHRNCSRRSPVKGGTL